MHRFPALILTLALGAALAGCGSLPASSEKAGRVYQRESFAAEETYSRLFDADVDATCEAARRALLSQGYIVSKPDSGLVRGTKHFQPEGEMHVEIAFNIVCVGDGPKQQIATAYVGAQQDRYALKKSNQAASLGVSALGSISVPLSASGDSLVKVASETIPAGEFYDRFFTLMQRMLRENTSAEH